MKFYDLTTFNCISTSIIIIVFIIPSSSPRKKLKKQFMFPNVATNGTILIFSAVNHYLSKNNHCKTRKNVLGLEK